METKVNEVIDKFNWIIDTAATRHFCNNINLFSDLKNIEGKTMPLAVGGLESPIEECHKFKDKTPYELYGCPVYVGTPKQLRNKLDLHAKHGIMLGYACSTRGYRIWLPDEKLIETCNVLFDESKRVSNGILNFPSPNS
ncbi:uncharacterized protein TNCV_2976761 [Trichonephila clavipes]|nr:uncharacterized protein TNCV_2976761 [Trichonephila clavipes]